MALSTSEAARMLGVTPRRVTELIRSGLLVAQRSGRSWEADEESVERRLSGERLRGRPKGGEPLRHLVRNYTLMCRNEEVVDLSFVRDRNTVASLERPKHPELLPVGACAAPGKASVRSMELWINERYIPQNRIGLAQLLERAGLPDPAALMFKTFGLNLTDQYWFRPQGADLDWEEINYFDNPVRGLGQQSGQGPDSGTPGMLPKWWEHRSGRYYLLKESQLGGREPYAELAATRMYSALLVEGDYVRYTLEEGERGPCSACACFTDRGTQLVTMRDLVRCYMGRRTTPPTAADYCDLLERVGVPHARAQVSKMLVCDYVDANDDRHDRNLGVIRDTASGEFLRVAPVFDNGRAFFGAASRKSQLADGLYHYDSNPFSSYPSVQLAQVQDFSWLDCDALAGLPAELARILGENEQAPAWFADAAAAQLELRVGRVAEACRERA